MLVEYLWLHQSWDLWAHSYLCSFCLFRSRLSTVFGFCTWVFFFFFFDTYILVLVLVKVKLVFSCFGFGLDCLGHPPSL